MADHVFDYFKSQLGRVPTDITLRELSNESNCGLDCCRTIDAAQAMIAFTDPAVHADIIEAAERDVAIKWRG